MNEDIEIMIKIYNTYEKDWMGDIINDPSDLTRHHIVKKEKDGESDISNYALLTSASHKLLHYMEEHYYPEYLKLQKLLISLNRNCNPPTEEYFKEVNEILTKVRKSIKNKNRKRKS